MKNIVDFPDKAALDEEAAEWLVRLDSEEPLSGEERQALAEWLARSPRHRDRLTSLAEFWGGMNALTELAVPLTPKSSTFAGRPRVKASVAGLAAATIAIVVAAALMPFDFGSMDIEDTNGLYSSAIGEQRSSALADGSDVVLNTNSQIRVEFTENYRDIHLIQGEVLFSVTEDPSRPFRVFAGGGRIQAVGTAFAVYLKDDSVDITVTEGSVSLSTAEQLEPVGTMPAVSQSSAPNYGSLGVLTAGQIASLPRFDEARPSNAGGLAQTRIVQETELARRMSWADGKLSFAGESLAQVVSEIGRYTTVKIEFADPEVSAIRVGGVFPVGETSAMFGALEDNFGLRVTYLSANRVLISSGE